MKKSHISLAMGASIFALAMTPAQLSAQQADTDTNDTAEYGDENVVVVTGQRASEIRSIEKRRESLGITDVAAADEIGQLPDKNIAEVVERLPGVGVQYDQGEGRYVSIRGVPSSLNGYTINGFEIGNPDGGTRKLPLDIVSGQLLNSVEIAKVRTPNQTGQGIGGIINLVQQTAFDYKDAFAINGSAQIGYQQLRKGSQPWRADLSVAKRFGADEQFGITLGGSYSDRTFTSYGLFPDDWKENDDAARGAVPKNIKYTDYRLNRERIGATGSLDYRGDDMELFLRGVYSEFSENEYRQRFRLDMKNPVFDANGFTGVSTNNEQRSDLRLEQKVKSIMAFMGGGQNRFDLWTLDYGVAYVHNEVDEPNQSWQFRGNPGDVHFDYTNTLYTVTPDNGYLTADDLGFRSYSEQNEQGEEDIWQARFDLKRELMIGLDSFVSAGFNGRWNEKSFDGGSTNYGRNSSPNRFTLIGLSGDDITVYPDSGVGYAIVPSIDEDKIRDFTTQNLNGPLFVLNESDTLADAVLNDFTINEDIYAGYVMANVEWDSIAVTAGLRVEHTKLDNVGFRLENEVNVVPVSQSDSYTEWLPTAIVRIKPSDDVVVRLAYTRSVGRPEYADLSPGGSLGFEDIGNGQFEGFLSLGNAGLKPYTANSLDAVAEWYFAPGGMVLFGAFAKFVKNPIFGSVNVQENVEFGGNSYVRLETSQPQNADKGDIIGLEMAWRQQFDFLPGLLSGFGVNANLTLVSSNLRVPGRANTAFPEQSGLLWGAQLFYQKGIVEGSVAYHHTGNALIGISGGPVTDEYNDNYRRLDAKIGFQLTDNFRVYFEGQNLTDEATRQYQGLQKNWIIQRERYGRTYNAGVSFSW